MHLKLTLLSADELDAAAAFCTALAAARRVDVNKLNTASNALWADRGFGLGGIERGVNDAWTRGRTFSSEPAAEEASVDEAAEQSDADSVTFPHTEASVAIGAEPPKRRGRPRKAEQTTIEASAPNAEPELTPIEEAIAELTSTLDVQTQAESPAAEQDNAPIPADPEAGWTTEDARNAGRALLARMPDTDTGNRKLADLLVPFKVLRVKELPADQIEAFVIAANRAVL